MKKFHFELNATVSQFSMQFSRAKILSTDQIRF